MAVSRRKKQRGERIPYRIGWIRKDEKGRKYLGVLGPTFKIIKEGPLKFNEPKPTLVDFLHSTERLKDRTKKRMVLFYEDRRRGPLDRRKEDKGRKARKKPPFDKKRK